MNSTPLPSPDVLVAGAGPTGMALALWLARLGVRVRIVDQAAGPGTSSRAIGVQARTLEYYRQIGLANEVTARGRQAPAMNVWVRGGRGPRFPFADMGADISPFPYALVFPQDEHEEVLVAALAAAGITVERRTEFTGFEEKDGGVRVRLKGPDGATETCQAAFLAGCDGAHSTVRESLGIGFSGGTYAHRCYVADIEAEGPPVDGEMHVAMDEQDFLVIFPLKKNGNLRLIGTIGEESKGIPANPGWEDADKSVMHGIGLKIGAVNWFSSYRVHHRVADHFRRGRAFLLGDAAHIHSPVGGQGLNAGIGDAANLAWKLASVLRGAADETLLDTYEPERISFARRLVGTTDRIFAGVTSSGFLDRQIRLNLVPGLLPLLFHFAPVRQAMFRTISQAAVNYRGSRLSDGRAGPVRGGDRLPWVKPAWNGGADNHAPLNSLDWQVHVYGAAGGEIARSCAEMNLPLHVFPWRNEMARTGLRRNAVYLVRPDGHVALAAGANAGPALAAYFDTRRIDPRRKPVVPVDSKHPA